MKIFGQRHSFILLFVGLFSLVSTGVAQAPNMTLTGVMSSGNTTNAYIEGSLYSNGQVLPNGFRIIEIREEGITIVDPSGDDHYFVPVGKMGDIEKLDKNDGEKQVKEVAAQQSNVSFVSTPQEEGETSDFDFKMGAKAVFAIVLILVGLLVSFIGQIWYLVACFKTSIWWGLGTLFLPFVSLIFLFMHWEDAKKPFLMNLTGALMAYAGIFMMPEIMNSF